MPKKKHPRQLKVCFTKVVRFVNRSLPGPAPTVRTDDRASAGGSCALRGGKM